MLLARTDRKTKNKKSWRASWLAGSPELTSTSQAQQERETEFAEGGQFARRINAQTQQGGTANAKGDDDDDDDDDDDETTTTKRR